MIDLFNKVKQQELQNLPFVVYKKPDTIKVVGYFQKNDHLYFAKNFEEAGFIFAPFEGNQRILIPYEQSIKWSAMIASNQEIPYSSFIKTENSKGQEHFESLVQSGIDTIEQGFFKKVVVSRTEIAEVPNFDSVAVFEKLIQSYPNAFCYCWFHPKIGLWMGATPERLLKANNNKISTMALAGTQKNRGASKTIWDKKEIEEQQLVTDFILNNLKDLTTEVSISTPYTLKAGTLLHIKTDIEGILNNDSNLKQVISMLHPTPAVCGLPKQQAKEFILENEGYKREYYTGFLGELNKEGFDTGILESDLYVNLRCMKIKDRKAHLYIGCGITKDSNPRNEWLESVSKSMTMKKVL